MNKRKILVPLGDKSYEVTLEAGILNNICEELLKIGITKNRKILVISNEEISNLYGEKFLNNLKDNNFKAQICLIKAGESHKNLKTLSEIYDVAFDFGLDRNSIIIALGGGIVGDVSGFAEATWLRGIEYIQIPTTLLSIKFNLSNFIHSFSKIIVSHSLINDLLPLIFKGSASIT